jgi:hypothetical protein
LSGFTETGFTAEAGFFAALFKLADGSTGKFKKLATFG